MVKTQLGLIRMRQVEEWEVLRSGASFGQLET